MTTDPQFDRLFVHNERYTEAFDRSRLTAAPRAGLAILTCMDARIDLAGALGIEIGDAHVIRNAAGLASDDAIRSLAVSQQLLGTRWIVVIGHTRCGLEEADEADLRGRIQRSTGTSTDIAFGSFANLEATVRAQVETLRSHPVLLRVPVYGLIYEVETGRMRPVA
jgi:carbonic anhydrase